MNNLDVFDVTNTQNTNIDQQPAPEPDLPEIGANPITIEPVQAAPVVAQGEKLYRSFVPEYTPKSEISQALIDNKGTLEELGIDGNRYDQFVAEVLPKAMETKATPLALSGTPDFYKQISGRLIGNESGGNYGAIEKGSAQAFGKYQFTPARLADLGYTGTTTDFLKSPKDQEDIFNKHMDTNYKWLEKNGMINAHTSPAEISGYLYAMHLGGYGGAKSIYSKYQAALQDNPEAKIADVIGTGTGSRDSNGTSVGKYFLDGYKYGSKLMAKGINSADDVVFNEARNWATGGKNQLADRDQAISRRGNAWLNSIRQYGSPEEAVDEITRKMANQHPATGDYWSSKRDNEGYHNSGVATEELTFWDRLGKSIDNTFTGTGEGRNDRKLEARKIAEQKLSEALGVTVDFSKSATNTVDEDMTAVQAMNMMAFGSSSFALTGPSNDEYERRFNDFISQAKQANPGVKLPYESYTDVLALAGKMKRESDEDYAYTANNYGGVAGGIAGFAGTMIGTLQDPIEAMKFLALAPVGAQFTAGSIAVGAAANAIAEIPAAYGMVQGEREMGLNPTISDAALQVGAAGLLGGVAPVIGHYVSKGYKATKEAFGSEVANVAEDLVQVEKNSPFPAGPDGDYKMEMMAQKASTDLAAGNPVAVVGQDAPAVKADLRQQMAPDGNISFKDDTTYKQVDSLSEQRIENVIEQYNKAGTASKEEYDAYVNNTPRTVIDETQALNGENNPYKKLQRQQEVDNQVTQKAVEANQSIKNGAAKTLTDSLENVRAKEISQVTDFDLDPTTASKVATLQDELQNLSEANSDYSVSAARNAREVITDLQTQKSGLKQAQIGKIEEIQIASRYAQKDLDSVTKELSQVDPNSHRAAFLKEAQKEHGSRVNLLSKAEQKATKKVEKLSKELDRLKQIHDNMITTQRETRKRLGDLAKTKGADAVKADIEARQLKLNQQLKEYQDSINQKKVGLDSKIDFYDTDEIGAAPSRTATVQELMDEANDAINFLKEVTDCLTNIGV